MPCAVLHDEAGFQFIDRPGRREAAWRHCGYLTAFDERHAQPLRDEVKLRANRFAYAVLKTMVSALIETDQVERVLADLDADGGDREWR